MNKSYGKLTLYLVLAIFTLFGLLIFSALAFIGIWLNTYKVFTKEDLVAEITVSGEMKDENGFETFELKYKPIEEESALLKLFIKREPEDETFGETQTFSMHGDHFEIGGQLIKFDDWATVLGFNTIYKVTRLEGDYIDVELAQNPPERSVEALNGGIDDYWKYLENNEDTYDFLVDTVFGNFSTKFIQEEEKTYGLYITEDGFVLEELE